MKHVLPVAIFGILLFSYTNSIAAPITGLPNGSMLSIPSIQYEGGDPQEVAPGIFWYSTNTDSNGGAVFGYTGQYEFGENGSWEGLAMAGLRDSSDVSLTAHSMIFEFINPLYGVGGFLNYLPGGVLPTIAVYDADMTLLEESTADFLTGGSVNSGRFMGFLEESPIIKYFILTDAYIAITDLTVQQSTPEPVPEPATLLLMGLGMAGLLARRRQINPL